MTKLNLRRSPPGPCTGGERALAARDFFHLDRLFSGKTGGRILDSGAVCNSGPRFRVCGLSRYPASKSARM